MDNETKKLSETEELLLDVKRHVVKYWRFEVCFAIGLIIGLLI